jgi:hypothetical protein
MDWIQLLTKGFCGELEHDNESSVFNPQKTKGLVKYWATISFSRNAMIYGVCQFNVLTFNLGIHFKRLCINSIIK